VVQSQLQQRAIDLNAAATKAANNIERAQEKQKAAYRRRRGLSNPMTTAQRMPPGSFVLMELPPRGKKKLDQPEGPYKVTSYNKDMTSALIEDATGKRWWVSSHRIAPYRPDRVHHQGPPKAKRRL
jgi:hypothetical protein